VLRSFRTSPEVIDSVWLAHLACKKSPSQAMGILRFRDAGKTLIRNGLLKLPSFATSG
jgi:hypothetical protein